MKTQVFGDKSATIFILYCQFFFAGTQLSWWNNWAAQSRALQNCNSQPASHRVAGFSSKLAFGDKICRIGGAPSTTPCASFSWLRRRSCSLRSFGRKAKKCKWVSISFGLRIKEVIFLIWWFFFKKSNDQQDLFNILGSMYIAVLFLGINNCSGILPYVAAERSVLLRERFSGMYSSIAYSVAQVWHIYLTNSKREN